MPNKTTKDAPKAVSAAALAKISLTITKANLQEDGTLRWQAVVSDIDLDRQGHRTSLALFQDWINRIETGKSVTFLPSPRMPFLGLSHYPDLDGFGEAGVTEKIYIDRNCLKVNGLFYTDDGHPLGKPLFEAIKSECDMVKRGETVEDPIRISAAWWDLKHSHGSFTFERKSLAEACPMCLSGAKDLVYLAGQPDHWAGTRVPVNPRTEIGLEEKSMAVTRKQDAVSIIEDEKLVDELEKRSHKLTGKSETETPALVIKAEGEALAEKMEGEAEEWHPLGGAMTLDEAEGFIEAQETVNEAYYKWSLFMAVMDNVLELSDPGDVITNMRAAIASFDAKISTLKAAITDAYLLEVVAKAGGNIMTDEVVAKTGEEPLSLEASIEAIVGDKSLGREAIIEAIQEKLNTYVETVKAEVDAKSPPSVGDQITKALTPLVDTMQLFLAKMSGQPAAQHEAQPQQKSLAPGMIVPGNTPEALPISPVTGQPSKLTAMVNKTVGV